ncbi:MAG TPA: hypothetical protein VH082_05815 [Rudaea sp.]|jgi:hypothetical protein|nr:hypothetical protein [Rudaea sp.]
MLFRALVFGTRLIRRGDRADSVLLATNTQPAREPCGEGEHWRFRDAGTITTFIIRSRRIVSIEQRAA